MAGRVLGSVVNARYDALMTSTPAIRFPRVPPGPDLQISASAYVAWQQCNEQAAARFRGEYGPDSVASFRGNLAHRIFARHLRDGPIDGDRFDQVCREEIGGSNLNYKMGDLSLRPSVLRGVIEEVGALYQRFQRLPADGFDSAEVSIEVSVGSGISLKGVVDAVYTEGGSVKLVDWKTGNLGEAHHQLDFYSLLWTLRHETIPAAAEAVSVMTGERIDLRFTTPDLQRVAANVAAMAGAIRRMLAAGDLLPLSAGPWCRYCVLLDRCSEGNAALGVNT